MGQVLNFEHQANFKAGATNRPTGRGGTLSGAVRTNGAGGLVEINPRSSRADFVGVAGFDGHPGYGQHGYAGEQDTALDCLPTAILVILQVESQFGPTVGPLDTGTAVKQGLIPGRSSSHDTIGIGSQVSGSGQQPGGRSW